MEEYNLIYSENEIKRLDQYLSETLTDRSRSFLKRLISEGLVKVDGCQAKPSRLLRGGEKLQVAIPPAKPLETSPEKIPVDILFEDPDLVIVNKPAGMVVHPAPGHDSGTLVNALLAACDDLSGIGGALRPGIVHRLDAGTTGAIVVAKNDVAHNGLANQFKERQVKKIYSALVYGLVESPGGEIDLAIGRDRKDRKKISAKSGMARAAVSRYEILEAWDDFTFLSVRLLTGRTHQVRVHLSHIYHPLVGDDTYGGARWRGVKNTQFRTMARKFGRPALHSRVLGFTHPVSGTWIEIEAPLPEDMLEFLKILRSRV